MSTTTVVCLCFWRNLRRLRTDCGGQDMIEYALITGFVAAAVVTMSPSVSQSFITVMSTVNSVMTLAASS
jgi:Flp pilus assembly pilin Flp